MVLVAVTPLQHVGRKVEADPFAVRPDRRFRVIQQVVGVEDDQVLPVDHALGNEVVKEPAELVIARLVGHEVGEVGNLVERRYRAAVIARNTPARMADEEGELEPAEHLKGDDGGIVGLLSGAERGANRGGLLVRREEVVGDILDKDSLVILRRVSGLSQSRIILAGCRGIELAMRHKKRGSR